MKGPKSLNQCREKTTTLYVLFILSSLMISATVTQLINYESQSYLIST